MGVNTKGQGDQWDWGDVKSTKNQYKVNLNKKYKEQGLGTACLQDQHSGSSLFYHYFATKKAKNIILNRFW